MEKSRKAQKSILIILLLIVVGLSIGFAAFTSTLKIQTTATVSPNPNTFSVVFSTSKTESVAGSPELDGTYASGGSFQAGATTLSGLKASFTQPGQTATWKVYAHNAGEFNAFLNSVTIGNISYNVKEGTDTTKVEEAVKGIKISVKVGNTTFDATNASISGHELVKGQGEEVLVTLTYASGSAIADGDFDVTIGDIVLGYDSID